MFGGYGVGWDLLLNGRQCGVQGPGHQHTGGGWELQALHVWRRNSILVGRMREQEMVAGAWMRMEMVKCVQGLVGGDRDPGVRTPINVSGN